MTGQSGFWIDVGGTFTDCLQRLADGSLRTHKLLSDGTYRGQIAAIEGNRIRDPRRGGDPPDFFQNWTCEHLDESGVVRHVTSVTGSGPGMLRMATPLAEAAVGSRYILRGRRPAPVNGIRYLLGLSDQAAAPTVSLRLGTTRGTNALLERKGGRVGLLITAGFADLLAIRDQRRPHLFQLATPKARPLHEATAEVHERISASGEVLQSIEPGAIRLVLEEWREAGIEAIAVSFLNSYRSDVHEQVVASLAREIGFRHVSTAAHLSPLPGFLRCTETTVVNAYLQPTVASYIDELHACLPESDIQLMSSAGGLVIADAFAPKDSILSGPAAGVVGAAAVGEQADRTRVLAFDMGGTSTDVSRYDDGYARRGQLAIYDPETGAELQIVAPQLEIETVAAGGGSICSFDGVKPTVGPESAGARPGPACYGAGGPLCITDVNLYLGRVAEAQFALPLDRAAVETRLTQLRETIVRATGQDYPLAALAAGYLQIANERMAAAIRRISIQRGADPRDFALVAFGGAGGQHCCAVAELLGIRTVLCHPLAGMLSAYGIGRAPQQRFAVREVGCTWSAADEPAYHTTLQELGSVAREALPAEVRDEAEIVHTAELRYAGQEDTLTVVYAGRGTGEAFADQHVARYGFALGERAIELVALRAEALVVSAPAAWQPDSEAAATATQLCWSNGVLADVPVLSGDLGDRVVVGPALLCEPFGTVVVDEGWHAQRKDGLLQLTCVKTTSRRDACSETADPIDLELFHNRFSGVAEDMGATLARAALSTNIRERHDYSCAVCDRDGYLVAHAPHVPVHLGAMGGSIRALLAQIRAGKAEPLKPGDVMLSNDPYTGGSHLPDVTAITPVFADGSLVAFVGNRAHHAEIGGITPGSMPPRATRLAEEGVVIPWTAGVLTVTGDLRHQALRALLESGPYPSRDVAQNLSDLRAQIAANRRGVNGLQDLFARYGVDKTVAYMQHLQAAADEKLRQSLAPMVPRRASFSDQLDDGTPLAVSIHLTHRELVVDFTGTGPVSETSLNATPAIVSSAVLYCLRCLVDDEIPLNEGLLRRVRLVVPEGLLNPTPSAVRGDSPGVAGGNVETSQRIVDCVLGAFGVVAASQGTMNNVTFGNEAFGYYETLGGGAGATPEHDGIDALHCHMTNTSLTDPETLERRFPVRLREFAIRRGSGGRGSTRGGDGMIRTFEFLAPLRVTLLTQRRRTVPYGLAGGEPGRAGRNSIQRADGTEEQLDWFAELQVQPGDQLRVETPGGGGYGRPI